MTQPDTGVEYEIWFNNPAGQRLHMKALEGDVQTRVAEIHADEAHHQALAATVGIAVPPTDLAIEVFRVTREPVEP
jgi:hypothetical protein